MPALSTLNAWWTESRRKAGRKACLQFYYIADEDDIADESVAIDESVVGGHSADADDDAAGVASLALDAQSTTSPPLPPVPSALVGLFWPLPTSSPVLAFVVV